MLFSEVDSGEIVKALVTLVSGWTVAGLGVWIVSVIKERRQSKVVATSDSIKKDRAKLTIDQDKLGYALENNQRAYDDLYAKYLDLYKVVETVRDLLLKSEIERAVAVTKLGETAARLTESLAIVDGLKRRVEQLEGRLNDA